MSPERLLEVTGLVKRFGGFVALKGVDFHVLPGEIVGLVGPNGSGKTTCINLLSGLYPPDGGRVLFRGRSVGGLKAHQLVHLGINRTFQVPKPFLPLTVRQNVDVAAAYGRAEGGAPEIDHLLGSVGLLDLAKKTAGELNNVQQKMLDLARALATAPKLLCVDELAAGLNPSELEAVAGKLIALAQTGIALVVVEHLMGFIDQVTDRVIVLNAGQKIFTGRLADAVQNAKVIELFLGTDDDD